MSLAHGMVCLMPGASSEDTSRRAVFVREPPVFSLSHSKSYAALIVGESPTILGVDAEDSVWSDDLIDVARRYFLSEEVRAIEAAPAQEESQRLFFACWTIKEAVCKAIGRGFSCGLDRVETVVVDGCIRGVKVNRALTSARLSVALAELPENIPVTLAIASSHPHRLESLPVKLVTGGAGVASSLRIDWKVHCLSRASARF